MKTGLVACLAVLLVSLCAHAQPLADRVPSDAIIYVGWQGGGSMPPAYQQSHLKAVLDSSNLPALFDDFLPRAMAKLGEKNPQAAGIAQLVRGIGGVFWRHPTAVYFAGVDLKTPDGMPRPKVGIICQAGAEADALLKQIQPLIQAAQQATPLPVRAFKIDNLVVVTAGYEPTVMPLAGSGAAQQVKALLTNERFTQAMAAMKVQPVLAVYADNEAGVVLAEQIARQLGGPDALAEWNKIKLAWGLGELKRVAFAAGFDGRNWGMQASLLPAPKSGPFANAAQPISEDILKMIPQSATWASVTQFDANDFIDTIRSFASIDGNADDVDRGIAAINQKVGLDLRKDLFDALGAEWAIYNDPSNAAGLIGMVIVNRPRNPAAAERSLSRLEEAANQAMASALRREQVRVAFTRRELAGTNIHTLGVPLVAPSWAVKDGALYIALYPHSIVGAAGRSKDAKSILDNADFIALRKQIGVQNASSVSFADLPRTAAGAYQILLPVSQLGVGFAEMAGFELPALVLPPLALLHDHLSPAASFTWTDATGLHYRSTCPFPGSELLAMDSSVSVGATALMTSIMLPALNAAKERANRVKCASNLRQIGQGCMLYANDFKRYPPNLGEMVKTVDLSPEVFVCPSGSTELPPAVRMANVDAQAKWVNENADYIYLGAKMNMNMPADRVLAYEKPDNHEQEGLNFLFNDGHVEWHMMRAAQELIRQQGQ